MSKSLILVFALSLPLVSVPAIAAPPRDKSLSSTPFDAPQRREYVTEE